MKDQQPSPAASVVIDRPLLSERRQIIQREIARAALDLELAKERHAKWQGALAATENLLSLLPAEPAPASSPATPPAAPAA